MSGIREKRGCMKLILSDRPIHVALPDDENIRYFNLSALKISNCVGCFGCWTKTPGRCVIRDDATKVYPVIAQSDEVLYVSHVKYGGYDSVMKTMLERAIPIQQAFIRIFKGETHHVQRAVALKQATIVAYGELTEEEKDIFTRLIARNAYNMSFASYNVLFVEESKIDETVEKIVRTWQKS